jgi:chromosome segregation ATPase
MKSSEEILQDPHAQIKKSGIAVLVVGIGVVALSVFLIFGWLLRDFLIFDSSRIQAERELSRITNDIVEAGVKLKESKSANDALLAHEKERLQKLIKEIADHNAMMAGKPQQEREYQELMAKIAQAKNESDKTISVMQQAKGAGVQELAKNSALKTDNATLEREKSNLNNEVSKLRGEKLALQQQKSALTTEVASLNQQQISVKGDMARIQGDMTNLKKEVDALTNRINNLKKTAPNQ